MEEHAGPEERQVTKTDEVGKLALALEEVWTTASDPIFMEPEQSLRRALNGCSSLRAVGLSLRWLIVAGGFYRGSDEKLQKFFGTLVRDLTVKQPTSGTRRVPGVFPLREGPLHALRSTLRRCSFEECTTNEDLVQSWAEDAWVYLCMVGSNILAGFPAALGLGRWSRLEADAATSVRAAVQRRLSRDVRITPDAAGMDEELKNRHIGYAGEEVSKCHPLSLKQILPSLPPKSHGGSIDALDWLGPRSREFLLHPERCLLPEEGLEVPNLPGRVHIVAEDKLPVAKELVSRSICRWIDLEEVHVVKGQRLLNGLFGVTKPTLLDDKSPVLRVIMNLVPINAITHQLQGAVDSLPAITAWQSLVLDGDETIAIWQSDMSSAFYLFKIPEQWGKYLSFNIVVDGASVGFPEIKKVALCSNVIPMGWSSSVGLMQEMAEALAYSGGLCRMQQIRKGSPIPPWLNSTLTQAEEEDRMWWHVYLDNFCAGERLLPDSPGAQGDRCHQLAEAAWNNAGVLSSDKKRRRAVKVAEELGAELDGESKTLGASSSRLLRVIQLTIHLLGKPFLRKKDVQILLGRWIFILQFRRPGMCILNEVWALTSGQMKKKGASIAECRRELVGLLLLCPLFHSFLGAAVSPVITASDASTTGGACAVSRTLTPTGWDFLRAIKVQDKNEKPCPILLISLFNGIGGCFRCYDIAGVSVMGRIAVEINKHANRIVLKTWPGTIVVLDVHDVDLRMIQEWALKFPGIEEIHLWAGFPCVDLSSVRFDRMNLEGPSSGLFWHIPRIKLLLKNTFGPSVLVKYVVENVASMDRSATEEISQVLETEPYRVDCVDAVPMHRPRYCWTQENIEQVLEGIEVTRYPYWWEVTAEADYPPTTCWIQPGYSWEGEKRHAVFPTCMKAIRRSRPPPKPAGLARCCPNTISRWRSDWYRFPPYQYSDQYLITQGDTWRLLSPVERELLLGYGLGHTRSCMSASEQKQKAEEYYDMRLSMLGDSFSIYSFVIFAVACSVRFVPQMSYKLLAQRMGLAPGFRSNFRSFAPLARKLHYGSSPENIPSNSVEQLNRFLLRRTNHTGSDVRVVSGFLMNPRCYPRQSVSSEWWNWEPTFQVHWKHAEHINCLELEAILLSIRFCVTHLHLSISRLFHITDSYVCMSIISKGRTSSRMLSRKLRHLAAYLLLYDLQLVVGHVDSSDNPTDAASRA